MLKYCIVFVLVISLKADVSPFTINPKNINLEYINILDAKELNFSGVNELSALAYKNKTLYALSDKGYLYNFKINIKNKKIKSLKLKEKFFLDVKKSKSKKVDSEGMVLVGNNLLISFERDPRVELFSFKGKNEKLKKKYRLSKKLQDAKKYASKNKMLEALAYSSKYGVISAPEKPFDSKSYHTIYGAKTSWRLPRSGDISALEFISKHKILVMQRSFNLITRKRVLTLNVLNLKTAKTKILAKLDSSKGWKLDNFEGLSKIKNNTYLMVSDDNDSFLQKTILVLFEIKKF